MMGEDTNSLFERLTGAQEACLKPATCGNNLCVNHTFSFSRMASVEEGGQIAQQKPLHRGDIRRRAK